MLHLSPTTSLLSVVSFGFSSVLKSMKIQHFIYTWDVYVMEMGILMVLIYTTPVVRNTKITFTNFGFVFPISRYSFAHTVQYYYSSPDRVLKTPSYISRICCSLASVWKLIRTSKSDYTWTVGILNGHIWQPVERVWTKPKKCNTYCFIPPYMVHYFSYVPSEQKKFACNGKSLRLACILGQNIVLYSTYYEIEYYSVKFVHLNLLQPFVAWKV